MDFHKKQKQAKLNEINRRTLGFNSPSINLGSTSVIAELSKPINIKDLNNNWGYKPIEVNGKFDHGKTVLIETTKEGIIGKNVVTPFYFSDELTGLSHAILVNRGFIEDQVGLDLITHNQNGYINLKGVLTKPHVTRYRKENDLNNILLNHIDLEELSKLSGIHSPLSTNVMIQAIDFNSDNESIYPLKETITSLNRFNASPETHSHLAKIFGGLGFLTLFGNMYFWVSL